MRMICAVVTFVMLYAMSALAQTAPACDGDITIVRMSTIKPGGTMQGFMQAMEAHKAWYRSHGFTTNEIYAAKVLVLDPATKTPKYSDTEMMTFHVRPPANTKPDLAWNAYVKQYRDNSDIKSEARICMPKTR